jgi:hypothetical protein
MKTSIKGLAVAAALAAGVAFHSPAAAQQGGYEGPRREQGQGGQRMDPQQRLERRVQQLTERLRLSNAQQGQVRAILQREQQQMEQFRGARGQGRQQGQQQGQQRGDDAQRRQGFEQMRQLRQQTDQQLERVLNSGQLAEYRKLQQERQQRGRDGQRGERPQARQGQR